MSATLQVQAPAIHCDGCAGSIKRSLGKLAGVEEVSVDVEKKHITAVYDEAQINADAIRERLTLAGFPPDA